MGSFDVLIAGGGSAGVAAAIAAARRGARTLLVERGGSLGGMASAALVHSICGLYRLPAASDECGAGRSGAPRVALDRERFANSGFAAEFAIRLVGNGSATGPHRFGRVDVLLQHPTGFAQLCDELVTATPNLEVRFHSEIIAAQPDFSAIELCCRGERALFRAKAIVDATGDAIVAHLGGAACQKEESSRLQRPAFIFAMHGVDPGAVDDDGRLKLAGKISAATQLGTLPVGALGAAFRASGRGSEVFVTIDLDAPEFDPCDARSLSALEIDGRRIATALAAFLRANVAGFADSFISAFPARIGIRESRRVLGEYELSSDDIERGARFPDDAVAVASWPIELRETARGAKLRFPRESRGCEIPLGALRAKGRPNLFVAGRCISCSHEAQASIRVIGTCLATGEAAGFAAALQALDGPCDGSAIRAVRAEISKAQAQ